MAENFIGDEKMSDVCAGEATACRAIAFLVERGRIARVTSAKRAEVTSTTSAS